MGVVLMGVFGGSVGLSNFSLGAKGSGVDETRAVVTSVGGAEISVLLNSFPNPFSARALKSSHIVDDFSGSRIAYDNFVGVVNSKDFEGILY